MKQLKRCTTCGHLIPVYSTECPYCSSNIENNTHSLEREEQTQCLDDSYNGHTNGLDGKGDESHVKYVIYIVALCCILGIGGYFVSDYFHKRSVDNSLDLLNELQEMVDTVAVESETVVEEMVPEATETETHHNRYNYDEYQGAMGTRGGYYDDNEDYGDEDYDEYEGYDDSGDYEYDDSNENY